MSSRRMARFSGWILLPALLAGQMTTAQDREPTDKVRAIPALIARLKDDNADVRCQAIEALGNMGETGLPPLIDALKDGNALVRRGAARALGKLGNKARAAVPALIDALKDTNDTVHLAVVLSLAEIAPPAVVLSLAEAARPQTAEPPLAGTLTAAKGALKDPSREVRVWAALALKKMGVAGQGGVSALVAALKDEEAEVRRGATEALQKIDPEAALKAGVPSVSTLLARLKDNNDVRSEAEKALTKMGRAAVPALIETLKDSNATVRMSAAWVLGKMRTEATAAIPALAEALRKDADDDVRWGAGWALGHIGPLAVPKLLDALKDPNEDVRTEAASALKQIELDTGKKPSLP